MGQAALIMSAHFSPIIMVVMHGLTAGRNGMIDASATRSPVTPLTRSIGSSGEFASSGAAHPYRTGRVVDGVVGVADVREQLVVRTDRGPRGEFGAGPVGHRGLRRDLAGEPEAVRHHPDVVLVREVARVDPRLVPEVTGTQPHRADGPCAGDVGGQTERVLARREAAPVGVHVERHGSVVEHQVGPVQARFGVSEDTDLPPLRGRGDHRLLRLPHDHTLGVVLEVRTDTRGVHQYVDPAVAQMPGRSDAGEHQQLR